MLNYMHVHSVQATRKELLDGQSLPSPALLIRVNLPMMYYLSSGEPFGRGKN